MPLTFMVLMIGGLVLLMVFNSRAAKKQAHNRSQMLEAIEPGEWVVTIGGFYLQVRDVDGDVFVVETHDGVELLLDKSAIRAVKEPPFDVEAAEDDVVVDDELTEPVDGTDTATAAPAVLDEPDNLTEATDAVVVEQTDAALPDSEAASVSADDIAEEPNAK